MTDNAAESYSGEDAAALAERHEDLVWWGTWIGLLVAAVGLVDGIVMALKKKEASCPDGKEFPVGATDFTCYVHPQAGVGIAISAICVLLGILILLANLTARASLRSSRLYRRP